MRNCEVSTCKLTNDEKTTDNCRLRPVVHVRPHRTDHAFASVPDADSRPLQVFTTALRVTVRDNLGNVVDSAQVQIFRTKEAYEQEINPVGGVQYTDKKGRIRYTGIEPRAYYINVGKR